MKVAAASLFLFLAAPSNAQPNKPITVIATFSILGDMVKRIGGEHIALTTLVGPDGDVHVYQPTPADARAVGSADLLFVNGLGFEGWMDRLVEASGFNSARIVATAGITPIAFEESDDLKNKGPHEVQAFKWAGLFDLEAGTYNWSFAKLDGGYADPAMRMVVLAANDLGAVKEKAERLIKADAVQKRTAGQTLDVRNVAYALNFDAAKEMTIFTVEIAERGTYAFFTEHMPSEFEHQEHFFKNLDGSDIEPVEQEAEGDHHHHNHGALDPHAWQSLRNAVIYANNITTALAKANPENASSSFQNRADFVAEIEALDAEIRAKLDGLPKDRRIVVTPHDAFGYFAKEYGLRFLAPQGIATNVEVSARDVAELINQIRTQSIRAIFAENITDVRLLEQIALETDVSIGGTLYSDALSTSEGPAATYLDMVRHNLAMLTNALGS